MTAFWKDLYDLFQSFETVTDLVGIRVYSVKIPQDADEFPVIVLNKISKIPMYTNDGANGTNSQFYQVRAWAETHEGANDLADIIEGLLSGYQGGMGEGSRTLGAVFLLNRIDDTEPETGLFSQIMDFQFCVN